MTREGRSIDPGLIVTPQGKKFLFVNDGKMAPLNDEGTKLTDTLRIVHRGWPIPRHWNVYGHDPLNPDNELTWTYYKEYPSDAVSFSKRKIVMNGKGGMAENSRVLLMTAGDLRYDIQSKIILDYNKDGTRAGLVLFYNEKEFSGVLVDGRQAYVYDKGKLLETYDLQNKKRSNVIDVRLCNSGDSLDIQFRCDNRSWTTLVSGLDISGMHHNKLKGFLALRPGLMVSGDDSAEFRNFKYKPKKN